MAGNGDETMKIVTLLALALGGGGVSYKAATSSPAAAAVAVTIMITRLDVQADGSAIAYSGDGSSRVIADGAPVAAALESLRQEGQVRTRANPRKLPGVQRRIDVEAARPDAAGPGTPWCLQPFGDISEALHQGRCEP